VQANSSHLSASRQDGIDVLWLQKYQRKKGWSVFWDISQRISSKHPIFLKKKKKKKILHNAAMLSSKKKNAAMLRLPTLSTKATIGSFLVENLQVTTELESIGTPWTWCRSRVDIMVDYHLVLV
jgi:hypothetical protein